MGSKTAVILCLLIVGAASAHAQQQPTGSWANETSGLQFQYGGSASNGTYMYLFGGYQYGVSFSYPQYYQACRRYDPANNAWTTMAYMPSAVFTTRAPITTATATASAATTSTTATGTASSSTTSRGTSGRS
jgi:hypothetical protein